MHLALIMRRFITLQYMRHAHAVQILTGIDRLARARARIRSYWCAKNHIYMFNVFARASRSECAIFRFIYTVLSVRECAFFPLNNVGQSARLFPRVNITLRKIERFAYSIARKFSKPIRAAQDYSCQ